MAFKASKKREVRSPEPISKGSPIIPSSALMIWYEDQMRKVVNSMIDDYRETINNTLEKKPVAKYFAADAAAANIFGDVLKGLSSKWESVFRAFGKKLSEEFVNKTEKQATESTFFSLRTAGLEHPVGTYNRDISNTLGAAKQYNCTLITGLQEDVHEKVYSAVMLSLTSPDAEEQGQSGIQNTLKEIGGFSKKRIELIARDQTSKLYSSLADKRMEENGIEEFIWLHSSAGKVPRQTHLDRDGITYKINDPRLWEGPKSDQGPPGWAINCRCRRLPVI